MTATPKEVIYSALTRDACFRRWATMVYQPKTAAAERLVRTIKNHPRFFEGIEERDTFMLCLRHGPRLPYYVRREAGPMWASYARWRRAKAAREAQEREDDEMAAPAGDAVSKGARRLDTAPVPGSDGFESRRIPPQ